MILPDFCLLFGSFKSIVTFNYSGCQLVGIWKDTGRIYTHTHIRFIRSNFRNLLPLSSGNCFSLFGFVSVSLDGLTQFSSPRWQLNGFNTISNIEHIITWHNKRHHAEWREATERICIPKYKFPLLCLCDPHFNDVCVCWFSSKKIISSSLNIKSHPRSNSHRLSAFRHSQFIPIAYQIWWKFADW